MRAHQTKTTQSNGRVRSRRQGFSYLEVVLGMTVMMIAMGGMVAAMLQSRNLARSNEESSSAYEAARRALEDLRNVDIAEIFSTYNDTGADDPDGVNTAPGDGFTVDGLNLQNGDVDGFVGRYEFPSGGAPGRLRETTADASFGMPRDLNMDGIINGDDRSGDYVILPVRVHVEWRGISGARSVSLDTLLSQR